MCVEVIIGGMYAGKSTELLSRLTRHKIAGKPVILFKPKIDNRYSEESVVTHSGVEFPAVSVDGSDDLFDLMKSRSDESLVVGIDEAQFFDVNLSNMIDRLAGWCSRIIVAGLDTDFLARPWPTMVPIVMTAENVTKVRAVCVRCGGDANFTQRLIDGSPSTHGDTVLVGGSESYEARCRRCYVGLS